jgi:hypothetical protein
LAAEHRQPTDDQRQFGVHALEVKPDGALAQDRRAPHFAKNGAVLRRAFLAHQPVERMLHIGGKHRVPVGKARGGMQAKHDREPVRRHRDVFGQQPIGSGGLVERAGQQRLEDQAHQAGRRTALQGKRVVLVEVGQTRGRHQRDFAPLGAFGFT